MNRRVMLKAAGAALASLIIPFRRASGVPNQAVYSSIHYNDHTVIIYRYNEVNYNINDLDWSNGIPKSLVMVTYISVNDINEARDVAWRATQETDRWQITSPLPKIDSV